MMLADYSHIAYEAARRYDVEAVYHVLGELVGFGRNAVDGAMRNWIDRTMTVMAAAGDTPAEYMLLEMESVDSGTGEAEDINTVPPEAAWAGRMFMAYVRNDAATWAALWSVLPADPQVITEHVLALLTTMTTTAAAYAENATPTAPRTGLAGWIRSDPETAAARIALSHLN